MRHSKYSSDGTMKDCPSCDQFYPVEVYYKRPSGELRPYCPSCQKAHAAKYYIENKEKVTAQLKRYKEKPGAKEKQRLRVRRWHYKNLYGISLKDREDMIEVQGNRCAICKTHFSEIPTKHIHVDHDHSTGKARGILCHHCNQVLGQCKDNISVLKNSIRYLLDHKHIDFWALMRERGDLYDHVAEMQKTQSVI